MSTIKKKKPDSPVNGSSPATQAARSSSRQDTLEKQVSGTASKTQRDLSPSASVEQSAAREGRPPTGRRKRKQPPPPPPPEEPPQVLDPFVAAVQNLDGDDAGAVMRFDNDLDNFDFDSEKQDGAPGTTVVDTTATNPHYLHAGVVSIAAIFFIVVFAYYINTLTQPVSFTEQQLDDIALGINNVVDSLLLEQQAATALLSVTVFEISHGLLGSQAYLEDTTAAMQAYSQAIQNTRAALSAAFRVHENYVAAVNDALGGLHIANALDLARLEHARNAIFKGGDSAKTLPVYDFIFEQLATYQSKLVALQMFKDPSDKQALLNLAASLEKQAAFAATTFVGYLNRSSPYSSVLRTFNTQKEFQLSWEIDATMNVAESFLRYGTSQEVFGSAATTDLNSVTYRSGTQQALNEIDTPPALQAMFGALQTQSLAGRAKPWNASYGQEILTKISPLLSSISATDGTFFDLVHQRSNPHQIVALTATVLLFVISVVSLVSHVVSSVSYAQDKEYHDSANREIRLLQKALLRMSTFVQKAAKLDVQAIAAVIRKAQRARAAIPYEEQQLYHAMTSLRDIEFFIPMTVTKPPPELSKVALTKSELFLNPALVHCKGAVAVRVSLSTFHCQFASAGVKQKALQHQMTRTLTALQEIADEHVPGNASFLCVQGDHALLWVNLVRKITYPSMRAISIAAALRDECERLGLRQPSIGVACGDALVGHVSSQAPSSAISNGHVSSFASFGSVAKDFNILDNCCRIHEVSVGVNNAAVSSYFQERIDYDSDIFNNNGTASVGFENLSNGSPESQGAGSAEGATLAQTTSLALAAETSGADGTNPANSIVGKGKSRAAAATTTSTAQLREKLSLEERFRRLHVHFKPLEMVNTSTSRAGEETYALLDFHLTLTKERQAQLLARRGSQPVLPKAEGGDELLDLEDGAWFKDYSRDLTDGSVMFPCFSIVPFQPARRGEEEKMLRDWSRFFDLYVDCCQTCTSERLGNAMNVLMEFASKYQHSGTASVERMKKLLLNARNTGNISTSSGSLKRSRLLDTLCV